MAGYTLIYLKDSKLLLSSKVYDHWKEVQEDYEHYTASLDFPDLDELSDFLQIEYKLSNEVTDKLLKDVSTGKTVSELNF